ncbi:MULTISPECIES: phosphoenolpyruvate--protein phosphotransferase [unclassified Sedimentibacter]|uniref:phosphoenolpyruvate--protein phosphotransferase n=1 Tax=unclassified Sedimentibacter TaxID=2649220 RepID=UPI0027E0D67A|nr:phosphoenolpyruvate--protein phosphotransferase [Sedimentibacter sp. MB35-C1]WMJ77562.1 phosphoenolpyruvate--protein phosphotransferase [Sedimentibacter sp. MB35-C1]
MKGLGVSPGIGIGKAFLIEKKTMDIRKIYISDVKKEIIRLRNAVEKGKKQLDELFLKTLDEVGEKEAQIFKSHEMMLEDESFISEVETKIESQKVNAEYALNEVSMYYIKMFENIEDEYLRERAEDIKDVMYRVIKILSGIKTADYSKLEKNSIIIAKDLTPSDTAQFEKGKVAAMITEMGGKTSHAAIIARILGIPTVVGLDNITEKIKDDDIVVCDGKTGKVLINPNDKQLDYFTQKKLRLEEINNELKKQVGLPTVSVDGFKVSLSANIGTPHDVDMVLENDAEGIGLFRSEFIFMNRECQPSEDEQFEEYREVLQKMGNKPVIIRTLDIGGDKNVPYIDIPAEMNPFLGYRAIRLCLGNVDVFRTQLRAVLRASIYGNVKIMFPMISTMKELKDAKKILEKAKQELDSEGIPYSKNIEIGIMIEIPSAAIISDLLAREVDFFSIGTNDLIQYTLAVDRMNSKLSHLYSQYHPAMLRLIKGIIDNAHKAGIWVGMCGEAAGDPKLIPIFLGMGLDEFSMNSPSILSTRYIIRNLKKSEMEKIAEGTLNMETAVEVEDYLSCLFADEGDYLNRCRPRRKN